MGFFSFCHPVCRLAFELIQNATPLHSHWMVNLSLTYHLMAVTQVGSRLQISTDRPPSAHLSLFDTNCTLSGSGRPAAFFSLRTKSALTVGHQRGEEASYLTRHTRVRLDVIKDKKCNIQTLLLLFYSSSPPALHPEPPPVLPNCSAPWLPHLASKLEATVVAALTAMRRVVASKSSFQSKRP